MHRSTQNVSFYRKKQCKEGQNLTLLNIYVNANI